MKDNITEHLLETKHVISSMLNDHSLLDQLEAAAEACINCLRGGHKILLAGNGGSAADAQHIACELVSRFAFDRPGLPAIALTTDSSIITAIANDCGYEQLFARQIQAHGTPGDIFIAYSTSGESANILTALEAAGKHGLVRIGMTGNREGAMQALCDYYLDVPSSNTPNIQEAHAALGHILCSLIENTLFEAPDGEKPQ